MPSRLVNAAATSEPNDRSFDDFTSGHSFDVLKLPKHVADLRLKLEHVMFAIVPRAPSRAFLLVRLSRADGACFRVCEKVSHAQSDSILHGVLNSFLCYGFGASIRFQATSRGAGVSTSSR